MWNPFENDHFKRILALNEAHQFDEALKYIKEERDVGLSTEDAKAVDMGEIFVRATRSQPSEIVRGLRLTEKYPEEREFLRWREIFLAQKMTLWNLEGKMRNNSLGCEAITIQEERAKILEGLMKSATEVAERDLWECKLATLQDRDLSSGVMRRMKDNIRNLTGTQTSQEMTALADHAIALQLRYLATDLLDAQPYDKAKDGPKSSWTDESPHLTPYNRRGHMLAIIAERHSPAHEAKIKDQFGVSKKLGCMNECRSMAWALTRVHNHVAKDLGRELATELGYTL